MKKYTLVPWDFRKYNWGKLGLELLVVFLGVTSGFLLNSWRERQLEEQMEQKYIVSFIKDVSDDIKQLEDLCTMDSLWLKQARENVLALQSRNLTQDSAVSMIKKIVAINKMEPHEGTYEDITNSGNLNIIGSFELKNQIADYHIAIKEARFVDDYFYKYFNDFVMPFIFSNFNVLTAQFNDGTIYKTVEFSNVFVGYFAMVQQRNSVYKNLLVKSREFKSGLMQQKKGN